MTCMSCCPLIGGDAGEEVRGLLPVAAGGADHSDGVPAVPHEEELPEAPELRL